MGWRVHYSIDWGRELVGADREVIAQHSWTWSRSLVFTGGYWVLPGPRETSFEGHTALDLRVPSDLITVLRALVALKDWFPEARILVHDTHEVKRPTAIERIDVEAVMDRLGDDQEIDPGELGDRDDGSA